MKRLVTRLAPCAVAIMVAAAAAFPSFAEEPDWNTLLQRIDALGRFAGDDFSAEITIVTQRPGKEGSTIVARYFRRDADAWFTIVMLKPDAEKGQGYFSDGHDLWFYDPESKKFAHWSMKDSFQDSVARNSDFTSSELAKDYTLTEHEAAKLGDFDTYVITLVARDKTVPVAKRRLWLRVDSLLPLKEEHYSLSDRLMRTIAYPKYQTVSGKQIPESILIVNNLKKGEKTQITFAGASVGKLPDAVFSKEYLERINQ